MMGRIVTAALAVGVLLAHDSVFMCAHGELRGRAEMDRAAVRTMAAKGVRGRS
jgi:hypothetical protein